MEQWLEKTDVTDCGVRPDIDSAGLGVEMNDEKETADDTSLAGLIGPSSTSSLFPL